MTSTPIESVRFVADLYPRLSPSDETIDSYRSCLDQLPPITLARDGILVDGYHRWQAHLREGAQFVEAENLGNLSDFEILEESARRNARHGRAFSLKEKRQLCGRLFDSWPDEDKRKPGDQLDALANDLGVSVASIKLWTKDQRAAQKAQLQQAARDLWLDCLTQDEIAEQLAVPRQTISGWLAETAKVGGFGETPPDATEDRPWGVVQHFDIWSLPTSYDGDNARFGKLPGAVVANLLWLFTEPNDVVVDLFAGAGTTIEVAKAMERRVWASDRISATYYPHLPIHAHDATDGWPADAPARANLIVLDPPYWKQAAGQYSTDSADLANMTLADFTAAWAAIIKACAAHLADDGRLAFIVSPAQDGPLADGRVVDLAYLMYRVCDDAGLECERRVVVPYSTQQATGQQVDAAREHRRLLKLYRDLVVMRRVGGSRP